MTTMTGSLGHSGRLWARTASRPPVVALAVVVGWIGVGPVPALGARVAAQEVAAPPDTVVTVTGNALHESTGEPIAGVRVRIMGGDWTTVLETDEMGQFRLDAMPVGTYSIALGHSDYAPLEGEMTIDRAGEFFMAMTPLNLDRETMTGIVGVVRDMASGRPVPDVVVNVPSLGRVATSDSQGRFRLAEMVPGSHEVVFAHLAHRQRVDTVTVVGGRVSRLDVGLAVEAIELTPIEVTVERQDVALQEVGFYQREEDGWGEFLDRENIEMWNPMDLTDALIRFTGVKISHDQSMPSRRYLLFRRAGAECFPAVYLDGIRMHGGGREPAYINDIIDPIAVAGVEMYRGTAGIPPQYWGTGSSCGVVLIWSRRS